MDLDPTEAERMVRELARRFAVEHVEPRAREIDEKDEFLPDLVHVAADLGLLGMELPEEEGGANSGTLAAVMSAEEIGRVSASVCAAISAIRLHVSLTHRFGSSAQRARWLKTLSSGREIGGFAITEPGAGSDVGSIKTTAVRRGDRWVINGQKALITFAPVSQMMIVLVSTDPSKGSRGQTCFIVEKGTPGLTVGPKESMMGHRGLPSAQVFFEDCAVPTENMLGEEAQGFKIMMSALDGTRLDVAALSLGLSQAAYEQAAAYAVTREQFGRPIGDFQGVSFMLAEMATEIDAGRLLLYRAARMRDLGVPFAKEASMAKYFCADNAMRHTTDAVQIFGGYGYTKAYPLERFMRDAKACQIYDGTSQIHRMIIARKVLQQFREST